MLIAGIDEAGRGPLAGPVVAACVILKPNYINKEITDSKKLSKKKREILYTEIINNALAYSIIAVGHKRIDQLNIREATKLAMSIAARKVVADKYIIDGNMLINTESPQEAIVKGDSKFIEISAASILAKTYRDNLMVVLDKKYPNYNFSKHAGYPTKEHKKCIADFGPTPVHRKTFRGVREFTNLSY
ncbi:UNVERIFIED_CONTAM: hypothetical protein GTU68_049548 [Idotea baltica]|nr:hypothetical protein [Idotea baltica]